MRALPNYAPKAMVQSLRLNANETSFNQKQHIIRYFRLKDALMEQKALAGRPSASKKRQGGNARS